VETPFEALFVACYPAFRDVGRSISELGVAVVAVHVPSRSVAGRLWVRAREHAIATAVAGRHSHADLVLADPTLSLRHVSVIVHPISSYDPGCLAYSVIDLRTPTAFHDEHGRHLDAVCVEGAAMLRVGPYALYFLSTGDPSAWPELATDAWAMLPDRVYVDERAAEPDQWRRRAVRLVGPVPSSRRRSQITMLPGPVPFQGDGVLREGEAPLGDLVVWSDGPDGRRIRIGASAARRGVLLGRYDRCESSDVFAHPAVSRSHLLFIVVADRPWFVDLSSVEGTYLGNDARPRVHALAATDEMAVVVGRDRAVVRWLPHGLR
jgi:pSer/pThr/pTyr-binding forkhead associated (FHA) protein